MTYTKTLEHYLRQSAESENRDSADHIDRTFWWLTHNASDYDEIIIDEGQDVSIEKYHKLKRFSENISFGADDAQSLYEDGCKPAQLMDLFPNNEEYTMQKNFRNSKEILNFTRSIFPDILIAQSTIDNSVKTEIKPIVKIIGWNEDEELKQILSIIDDYSSDTENIGILVPSQNAVNKYFNLINDELAPNNECTKYESDMNNFEGLSGIHITTFKSSKGTEFDTVIIPNFDSFEWMIQNTQRISQKDYFVAFTRAKINLFLICKNNPNRGAEGTFEIERS